MYAHNANANEGVSHLWNEFQYVGLHGGVYDINERSRLFAGINGFYHTYTVYNKLHKSVKYSSDGKPMWEEAKWTDMNNMKIYRSTWYWKDIRE